MNFSDPQFIQQLKEQNHAAFDKIITEYHEALFRGALKQGLSLDQAEEVVQSTWNTFFEKVQSFEGRSHIRTFIFGVLYNKIKELWRSNKKYTGDYDEAALEKIFDEHGHYLNSPLDPAHWSESKELAIILRDEIEKLPENQRLAFTLKEVEGESTESICNILDISITNLGVLIYRAKNNLRLRLQKRLNEDKN